MFKIEFSHFRTKSDHKKFGKFCDSDKKSEFWLSQKAFSATSYRASWRQFQFEIKNNILKNGGTQESWPEQNQNEL